MSSRVPPRFREATMASLDRKLFGCVVSYWENRNAKFKAGEGLALCGTNGVGKTWALAAMTNSLQKIDHEFISASKALQFYTQFDDGVWDEYRDTRYDETLETVPWLVLNDLGKEYRGGKLEEQMTQRLGSLLRVRSENMLVTHITTNIYPAKKIREVYGDSIASLLNEMCEVVDVAGPDRRSNGR